MDDAMPKIVELPGFTVAGCELLCQPSDIPKIPELWDEFIPRLGELAGAGQVYGVCLPVPGDPHAFRYLACAQIPAGAAAPSGMVVVAVPGAKYAVYPFRGLAAQMSNAFQEIYERRLAAAGLAPDHSGPCLELYPEDCMDEATGEMTAELYIAVQ